MKKIYLFLLIACFSPAMRAQISCNPDPIIIFLGVPGIYPNQATGGMIDGTQGSPYTQVFTVVVPADTTIDLSQFGLPLGVVTLAIDALTVTAVDGLPSGLTYGCDNAGCAWAGGADGCFKVSGTPTQSGTFTVDIQTTITLTVPVIGPFTTPPLPVSVDLTIGAMGTESLLSSGFDLGSNQPDPFTSSTLIPFTTSKPGDYQFTVTDMNGRIIESRNVSATAGENQLTFEAANLPAGLYHYRFEQNGAFAAGKMTVVR
jgi:hypothetical protein